MGYRVFVDESIHDADRFIVTAFVFGDDSLEMGVDALLRTHGMTPGHDEFKSGAPMREDSKMRGLRGALKTLIIQSGAPVALLISAASRRAELGGEIVETLRKLAESNGEDLSEASVFVDGGIRRPRDVPSSPLFAFNQDSKTVLGLQCADLVAAVGSYILLEGLHGPRKVTRPYGDDVEVDLGWAFKMGLRQNFWRKHPEFTGENYDEWFDAKLLGYGVFLGQDVPASVGEAVESVFLGIWLGCTR